MAYTTPTLAQAKADLASRLNDPSFIHWVEAELTVYLQEALRWWNAATAHWRTQDDFTGVMSTSFYDLGTEIPDLRELTVTNWDLVTDMQYALLEPAAAGGTWTGTDQFSLAKLSTAIQGRRDQFLRETGSILTNAVTAVTPPASGRITLDEAVLTVRRAAWKPTASQLLQPMLRTDEWAANQFSPGWLQATELPFYYSVSVAPPLTVQIIPPTSAAGSLDLVSINKGAAVVSGTEAVLGISNDFAWAVKFGALADLLSNDGLALDPARSAYCESRWQEGVALAKKAPVVLAGRINGVTVRIGSLADADSYDTLWQLLPGEPEGLLLAGQNLIATTPRVGGGGPYTITLDVVQNAPIPTVDADILQVGQDIYDAILDYAQHLCLFKEGPGNLQIALGLLNRAQAAAGVELTVQQASQPSRRQLLHQTNQDSEAVARELPVVGVDG